MSSRFPGRRLSPVRLTVLILALAAAVSAGFVTVQSVQDTRAAQESTPWFGAYVDVTAFPPFPFEQPTQEFEKNVLLSFIVAASPSTCEASWGGYHSLDGAQQELELDRRVLRQSQFGGEIIISFGGEANAELALACDTPALASQYLRVIDRYDPAALDFDIEGEALTDVDSRHRRVQALAQVQDTLTEPLPVWLTLPAGRDGLTPDGVAVVREFLTAGIPLAGVNAMTMNFTGHTPGAPLAGTVTRAAENVHRQLRSIYADAGRSMGTRTLWRHIGITPMIGQNDVPGEVFTVTDAESINAFAHEVGVGRLSLWSANRDRSCADAYIDLSVVSESCSGVEQETSAFRATLGAGFEGIPTGTLPQATADEPLHPEEIVDDPATSPYPIWNDEAVYPADIRVVWRNNVYEAKWWNTEIQPDDPTVGAAASPWQLVGPVLDDETPFEVLLLPEGTYPEWDPRTQYDSGDRILVAGFPYEARWWTVGDDPQAGQADPASSPWRRLTEDEVAKLLAE